MKKSIRKLTQTQCQQENILISLSSSSAGAFPFVSSIRRITFDTTLLGNYTRMPGKNNFGLNLMSIHFHWFHFLPFAHIMLCHVAECVRVSQEMKLKKSTGTKEENNITKPTRKVHNKQNCWTKYKMFKFYCTQHKRYTTMQETR